ncbi:MAG: serine acetyltransferase [bacterium]
MKYLKQLILTINKKLICYFLTSLYRESNSKETLHADISRWKIVPPLCLLKKLEYLFLNSPEFRSLFYYRIQTGNFKSRILNLFYPPLPNLYILTQDIGPGLFIEHGFSTIISAKKIGRNFWVNQQVTIGFSDKTNCPEIGDDVTINAGALVIGGVSIGDRARIGAGAVVVKSVPSGCTVVGNPAYIIKRNGIRVRENL